MVDRSGDYKAHKQIKITDIKVALEKARSYCAYQERCQQEMRDKLYTWGLYPDAIENIISSLINENFINEERFAKQFAGGKFRIKRWGKVKITVELQKKRISPYCIKKGIAEINGEDYIAALKEIIEKKSLTVKDKNLFSRNHKIASYAMSRGFESDLVWDLLKD